MQLYMRVCVCISLFIHLSTRYMYTYTHTRIHTYTHTHTPGKETPVGGISLTEIEHAIRPQDDHFPVTRLVCLENSHNLCGAFFFLRRPIPVSPVLFAVCMCVCVCVCVFTYVHTHTHTHTHTGGTALPVDYIDRVGDLLPTDKVKLYVCTCLRMVIYTYTYM